MKKLLSILCITMFVAILSIPTWVEAATEYDMGAMSITIDAAGDYNITGTTTTNTITVEGSISGDVNITLSNVNIDVSSIENACAFSIGSGSIVNITLSGENVLKSGRNRAGFEVPEDATVNISDVGEGTGQLNATGGKNGAGIGGGYEGKVGTINISGGTINATGGYDGAGIGGGWKGDGGNITISGGTINAKGVFRGAGIGGGYRGDGGSITISGGTVTANGGSVAAGIGGGYEGDGGNITISGGTVTANGGSNAKDIGHGQDGADGTITITGGSVKAVNNKVSPQPTDGTNSLSVNEITYTAAIPDECVQIYLNDMFYTKIYHKHSDDDDFYIWAPAGSTVVWVYDISDGPVTINTAGEYSIIGTSTTNTITVEGSISDDINITLIDVDIDIDVGSTENECAFCIGSGSTVNITLIGENVLNSDGFRAGCEVPDNAILNILGTGQLTATGGDGGAGIGGRRYEDAGIVNISSGMVIANGGTYYGAGIGGGYKGDGGSITISGGTVTANGGYNGAGIGGGSEGYGVTVNISGGTVTATGDNSAAGIGGGSGRHGGSITISGGTVTATSDYGAGIGGGYNADGGIINISSGTINATGGYAGAGIGGGNEGDGGSITISGGTINAIGGNRGAGIGSGSNEYDGNITISGGIINATGGYYGAGIGGGADSGSDGGSITISGGTVTANGGSNAKDIGSGKNGADGTITITGGSVKAVNNKVSPQPTDGTNDVSVKTITYTAAISDGGVGISVGGELYTTIYHKHPDDNNFYIWANSVVAIKLTGTVAKTGSAIYGETLTVNITGDNSDTDNFTYKWYRDDEEITGATSSSYTLAEADIGNSIKVRIESDDTGGYLESSSTAIVQKANYTGDMPSAPIEASKTHNSITLESVAGYEYSKNSSIAWQDSNVFSGLNANTSYGFIQRVKETATHKASIASSPTTIITTVTPVVDAETPVITNNITNRAGQVGDTITLDATATVSDGGTISYQWYSVDNESKANPQELSETTAVYTVNTSGAGVSYYYCEVINTNNSVNGNTVATVDSNVAKVTITTVAPSTKSMTSYNPVTLTQTGNIANNNVQYQTASEVINALPLSIAITLEDGSTKSVPVSWTDTDGYDATTASNYTFTATWGVLPSGVDNDDNISAPICEVNVAQGTYIDAETPVITNNLTDKTGQVGDTITLNATATVSDGGTISYQWYEVDDKSKSNPQALSVITETYAVNRTSAAISYYYCEVTNTNTSVNGNTVATVDSNVAKVTITSVAPSTKSMKSYNPVTLTQTGDIANNNVQYQTASEVINALPLSIAITLEDGSTKSVPVSWTDTDGYDATTASNYTFTATWGVLPSGVDNDDNISAPICEVNVAQGTYIDAETPVITNNLTDKTGQVGDTITLNATATVSDGGTISYQWYEVDDKSKSNPQALSVITETYAVNRTSAAISYYYCEVTNTNTSVNGNTVATVDSNVAKVTITSVAPSTKSMKSYNPVTLTQTGDIANNNVQYQTASEVINALPLSIAITLEDGSTKSVPVSWTDTDGYDATTASNYTFTATWGVLPSGVDNDDNISVPTCEVNVAQGTYIDAETPVITNNLTDKTGQVGDTITLNATATVSDGGTISYQWYEVDDKSKSNPQALSVITETYAVNRTSAAISYYYCEVTNTNTSVNGNTVATVDSNVAKVTITSVAPSTKSMKSYNPVTLTQTGDIANNNVQYQTASEVINALPLSIAITLEDGSTKSVPVSWTDTDGYDATTASNYTFTATWGALPSGVDNDDNISAPTCELKVVKGSTGGGSSSGGSSNTPRPKKPTEKAKDEIKKAKPNVQGIIQVSVEAKTTSGGKTTFELPSNFLGNEAPVELTIENDDLQVTLLNEMFTEKEKQVELIIEPTNKEELGLSEEEKKEIGDTPVYNIYLKINGKKVDWKGDEDIAITINLDDKENKEDHKFVAVYYDRKGNMQILKSSYYQNGKLYFTTKHLSDYGVVYVEPTFKDIENHWAKEAIEALTARGIIKGVSKDEFGPEQAISRADLVTLMVRYFGFISKNEENFASDSPKVFNDVDSSKYYAESIAIAKEIGLVKGCGNNMFEPLEPISRQDMMVLLQRAIEISGEYPNIKPTGKSYLNFSDSNDISSYALKSVELMINSEIVKERLEGIYSKENATRAEVAHALYNIMKTNMK